jgi:hypothetical protein
MADMVKHPGHYNAPGRRECIEEMIDVFGIEEARIFCKLNVYKYLYRHELKNGEQDLQKANEYEQMYIRLGERMRADK